MSGRDGSAPALRWKGRTAFSLAAGVLLLITGAAARVDDKPWSFGGPLPGALPFDAPLVARLGVACAARPAEETPRTRHLNADGSPKYTNRLFLETSPYLRQHAHNPVNWFPWGDEAFAMAKATGRPVLLSIGYSTCHWCHVMEEESFEDEEIARFLNEQYVAIKVDREERPDVDAIYMAAVQALTGSGGWPMTTWLTPERKPFFGGTYFPAAQFRSALEQLSTVYASQPDRVAGAAAQITQRIQQSLKPAGTRRQPGPSNLLMAAGFYRERFDTVWGGLKGRMKFPSALPVRLLLRLYRRIGQEDLLRMVTLTLDRMAEGGIHDQLGGGFHRYSTDAEWQIPHFEKMLYDNALLAMDYLEAYQVTGAQRYAEIARRILRYIERDMTSPDGVFYSATDADSPGANGKREEGLFFTWTPGEIEAVLGPDRARVVVAWFGVTQGGNFEGRNILYTPKPLDEVAKKLGLPPDRARAAVEESRELMYAARARRAKPLRDEKILTAWNALMISAYARAALVLGEPRYARAAERAADFLLARLRAQGRLWRSFKDGRAHLDAYLEDYAFFIAALLDLFEATGEPRWLREAIALEEVLEARYEDKANGGFFLTSNDHERLLVREKPAYDGAEPSGNSVEILNLLRLHEVTAKDAYLQRANGALAAFGGTMEQNPAALSEGLLALDFVSCKPKEVVIVTRHSRDEAEPLLGRLRTTFLPNRVLLIVPEGEPLRKLSSLAPLVEGKVASGGQSTAYVCRLGVCNLPTTDPAVFERQLRQVDPLPVVAAR